MRGQASYIIVFMLPFALFATLASARPVKSAHRAAAHGAAHGGKVSRVSGTERPAAGRASGRVSRGGSKETISGGIAGKTDSRRHSGKAERVSRKEASAARGQKRHATGSVRTVSSRNRQVQESGSQSRKASASERPAEQPATAPSEQNEATASSERAPIQVRHNRKLHLTPDANPSEMQSPRKATVQDFLSSSTGAGLVRSTLGTPARPTTQTSASQASAGQVPVSQVLGGKAPDSVVVRKLPVVKAAAELVPDPVTEPVLYTSRGRLIVPPAMKGSREILVHQNEMADMDGLIRVQDDVALERLRGGRQLVSLPTSAGLEVDERLPVNRRYCRPWTAQFLATLASAHYARFHTPLQVNSAVRTVEFQERLRYTNGNAAPAEGEIASPHLTGQAIDLAKHGLSMTEIAWLRGYLMPLMQQGKVDVEEEFQQACFHISVYKSYVPGSVPKREIDERHTGAAALAATIR